MKKVSLIAILALAACAGSGGGDPLTGEAHRTLLNPLTKDNPKAFVFFDDAEDKTPNGFLNGFGPEANNGTKVELSFQTGTSSSHNPAINALVLKTIDTYDDGDFTRERRISEDLFTLSLGGRAVIANLIDNYTVFTYDGPDPEGYYKPYITPQSGLEGEKRRTITDEFQVALGGGVLGLEFSDFGYWRALYYSSDRAPNGKLSLESYDFQPIFGGRVDYLIPNETYLNGQTEGKFTGNAVALITYARYDGSDPTNYDEMPIGGSAEFDLTSKTLTINFDRWYTMTFTDTTGTGKGGVDSAEVTITNPKKFDIKTFAFKNIDNPDTGILAYSFYSTVDRVEMVGGFQYLQTISEKDSIREILGIAGGFGGVLKTTLNRADDKDKGQNNIRPVVNHPLFSKK